MISPKQKKILAFPYSRYDSLICDGAVRSGKTSIIMWAFIEWAMISGGPSDNAKEDELSKSLREMAEELESDESSH